MKSHSIDWSVDQYGIIIMKTTAVTLGFTVFIIGSIMQVGAQSNPSHNHPLSIYQSTIMDWIVQVGAVKSNDHKGTHRCREKFGDCRTHCRRLRLRCCCGMLHPLAPTHPPPVFRPADGGHLWGALHPRLLPVCWGCRHGHLCAFPMGPSDKGLPGPGRGNGWEQPWCDLGGWLCWGRGGGRLRVPDLVVLTWQRPVTGHQLGVMGDGTACNLAWPG